MNFLNDILPLKNKLYRTALRITHNRQEAEDIVQNTLIRLWNQREEAEVIRSVEAYAFTICRNLSLDYLKQKENKNISIDEMDSIPTTTEDPYRLVDERDNIVRIRRFIDSLPEHQRSCIHLRDIEGLTYREIATILSLSEEQVKINIYRARQAIRKRFLS